MQVSIAFRAAHVGSLAFIVIRQAYVLQSFTRCGRHTCSVLSVVLRMLGITDASITSGK